MAKRSQKSRSQRSITAKTLLASAAAIPLVGIGLSAGAQSRVENVLTSFKFAHYEEYQGSGQGRMRVNAPMGWFKAPVGAGGEIEGSMVFDSMSGASTYYLSSLTGASGAGVHDDRYAGDVTYTQYFDRFSVGLGAAYSDENDYNSIAGTLQGRWWTEDKNTVLAFGASPVSDDITSDINEELDENRDTQNYLFGITQIIDPISLIQSNITFSTADGYLSDPYKAFDSRPQSRDAVAWLTRYVRYIESADASIHFDYRFFADSWELNSHTFEIAWYQPVGENWMIRPGFRYYSQDSAEFFSGTYPPPEFGNFYSADQRMGSFGGVTPSIKVARELGAGVTADVLFEYQHQRDDLKFGGNGTDSVEPFSSWYFLVGLSKRF